MKTLKKVLALMLAMAMVLALGATAFADDVQEGSTEGSITISNPADGETYTVYKVFDLTYSFPEGKADDNTETGNNDDNPTNIPKGDVNVTYTYTKTKDTDPLYEALAAGTSPFVLTPTANVDEGDNGVYNVSLNPNFTTTAKSTAHEADGEEVGNWIKRTLVETELLTSVDAKVANDNTVVEGKLVFDGLNFGYYYISTTQGTLVTVNSTLPEVTVVDKTEKPSIEKYVYEMDSFTTAGKVNTTTSGPAVKYFENDANWGTENDASFEDTVYFTTVVSVKKGALNYVVTDKLDEGLKLNTESIEVDAVVAPKTTGSALTKGTDYTIDVATAGGFVISFVTTDGSFLYDNFYNNQEANKTYPETKVYISYNAVVQDNAVINGDGNKNVATLDFGTPDTADDKNEEKTTKATTTTYVHDLDVFKFYVDATGEHALPDADFALFVDKDCKIPVTLAVGTTEAGFGTTTGAAYKFSNSGTIDGKDNTRYITTGDTGYFKIYGLDSGTYYLKEMDAPAGYNLLEDPLTIVITENGTYSTYVAEVENKTGIEFPSTGGIGTTIFYVLGSILVLGASIILISKKRMADEE